MEKYVLFPLLVFIISCNSPKKDSDSPPTAEIKVLSEGIAVDVQQIEGTTFQKQIVSNGLAEAKNKSELRFKINERIARILVKNGQQVRKGQLLANLDNELLYNQLQRAEIQFETAKNKFTEEKINYGQGNKAVADIDSTILKSLYIRTGYLEAENQLQNARILYDQTLLKAPFSGLVANITVKAGSFMTGGEVFCTLVGQETMEVVFSVFENEMPFLKIGKVVEVIPFIDKDKIYKGKVIEVNPLVDENGLVRIKADITNNDAFLFDGMNVRIMINEPLEGVIMIPKEALVLRSNREVVFTLQNGLAKWNYVTKLDENSNSYAISEGLKANDTIIVSGNLNLAHDAKVIGNYIALEEK